MSGLYRALLDKRQTLVDEGDSIAAEAEAAGDYTEDQTARISAIEAEMGRLNSGIQAEETRRGWERSAPADEVAADGEGLPVPASTSAPTPFASFGEQMLAVMNAGKAMKTGGSVDTRLLDIQAATGASTITGQDGGFAVQTDFTSGIVARVFEVGQLAARATPRMVGPDSNSTSWNEVDETTRANGSRRGGITVTWVPEGGAATPSRPKYRLRKMSLAKAIGMYVPTSELLADATALQSFVEAEFVDELAFSLDDQMVRGPGAGVPQGILTADGTIAVAKETGQAGGTFVSANVKKMYQRLMPSSFGKAAWFINNSVWEQIWSLNEAIGTGGVPLFIPAGGLTDTPAGTLLGRPIIPIEQAEALGTKGDVILADWSQYYLLRKGSQGIQTASSIHVYFDTDEVAFRWTWRINGEPVHGTPITPYKGTTTVAPFVVLNDRS